MFTYYKVEVVAVSGSGKENTDFSLHSADKKDFYGLVKKRSLKDEQVDKDLTDEPLPMGEDKGQSDMLGIDDEREQSKPELLDEPRPGPVDDRIGRLFKTSQSPVAQAPRPRIDPAPEPRIEAQPESPVEKESALPLNIIPLDSIVDDAKGIMTEAEPSPALEPVPEVATYGPNKQTMAPSGQETQNPQMSMENLGSEEDIIKEFNTIVKPEGIQSAESIDRNVKEKDKKKDKKKIRPVSYTHLTLPTILRV